MAKLDMNPSKLEADSIATKAAALAFLKSIGREMDETEIVIRYARRELALAKDKARRASGKAATVYLPANVDALPAKVRKVVATLAEVAPHTEPAAKPAPKAPKSVKPASQPKAEKPAPKPAAAPVVHKRPATAPKMPPTERPGIKVAKRSEEDALSILMMAQG